MSILDFRPMKHQEPIFQMPRPKLTLIDGGCRSGKTLSAAALIAALVLDIPITFEDGTEVQQRLPWQKNRPLTIWIWGTDYLHIGSSIYPALFEAGAFKSDGQPARPLIPREYLKDITWNDKNNKVIESAVIHAPGTGEHLANIRFFSSKSNPWAGVPVDVAWADGNTWKDGRSFLCEMRSRITDRDGQIIWSSWFSESDKESGYLKEITSRKHEPVNRVSLSMTDNKHLPQKAVESFLAGCASDEERFSRNHGAAI